MTEELYYICIDKQLQRWWEGGLGLNIYTIKPDMQKAPSRIKIQDRLENSKFRTSYFLRSLLHSTYVSISSDFVRKITAVFFFKIWDSQTELSNYFGELMKILDVCTKIQKNVCKQMLWFTAYFDFMIQTFNDLIWQYTRI